jgi:hypothetical protein
MSGFIRNIAIFGMVMLAVALVKNGMRNSVRARIMSNPASFYGVQPPKKDPTVPEVHYLTAQEWYKLLADNHWHVPPDRDPHGGIPVLDANNEPVGEANLLSLEDRKEATFYGDLPVPKSAPDQH